MSRDLEKTLLYQSVKTLLEEENNKISLPQHKLYTLFSIAFQYTLYSATKAPGHYIIRIEDSMLAEKLARKSKDPSTRKFMQALLLPRKLKYHNACFYLDFFHIGTWNLTKDLPRDRIKGALVVKNLSDKPMDHLSIALANSEANGGYEDPSDDPNFIMQGLPKDYYLNSLTEFVPNVLIIGGEEEREGFTPVSFPFIKNDDKKTVSGVTLSKNLDWDSID